MIPTELTNEPSKGRRQEKKTGHVHYGQEGMRGTSVRLQRRHVCYLKKCVGSLVVVWWKHLTAPRLHTRQLIRTRSHASPHTYRCVPGTGRGTAPTPTPPEIATAPPAAAIARRPRVSGAVDVCPRGRRCNRISPGPAYRHAGTYPERRQRLPQQHRPHEGRSSCSTRVHARGPGSIRGPDHGRRRRPPPRPQASEVRRRHRLRPQLARAQPDRSGSCCCSTRARARGSIPVHAPARDSRSLARPPGPRARHRQGAPGSTRL
jgi:hypothetical protein